MNFLDKAIVFIFHLLFFLIPLVLTPINYELFEYNKMMLIYVLTTGATGMWIIKMILHKHLMFTKSPLDLPISLFAISQIISTIFSIDPHVSIFGYYSRFNGGLLSIFSYLLLYYCFLANFPKEKITALLKTTLISAVLVTIYGVAEHFGIDKDIWVQDVQNRVFSTLGQPNWLAAYLAILIPFTISFGLNKITIQAIDPNDRNQISNIPSTKLRASKDQKQKANIFKFSSLVYLLIALLFYLTLLYTRSRSGFAGFWFANIIFWLYLWGHYKKEILKFFLIYNCLFLILTFISGTPFNQVNRFTLPEISKIKQPQTSVAQKTERSDSSIIDTGITESGQIRNIVWAGAIDIFAQNPLIGTGVETFAFAYYKERPIEHNMTSEWDFLYNKAHNEYLNYAANTGIFGLGSYLLIIALFELWFLRQLLRLDILSIGLFLGWLTILITNFFGFSITIVQLFFYLTPAIIFVLSDSVFQKNLATSGMFRIFKKEKINQSKHQMTHKILSTRITNTQKILILLTLFITSFLEYKIASFWYADTLFATGFHLSRLQKYAESYQSISQAVKINPQEPLYHDEIALPAAQLAVAFSTYEQATYSAQMVREAVLSSDTALAISPQNVNFWKSRARIMYILSQLDEQYLLQAATALENASDLSPTDPKITYNLALIYDSLGKTEEGLKLLEKTVSLKQDFRDGYYALGVINARIKQKQKAREYFNFILNRLNPADEEVKKQLVDL